jgi:hypothetical protein
MDVPRLLTDLRRHSIAMPELTLSVRANLTLPHGRR